MHHANRKDLSKLRSILEAGQRAQRYSSRAMIERWTSEAPS
jgi:hypothetical protein